MQQWNFSSKTVPDIKEDAIGILSTRHCLIRSAALWTFLMITWTATAHGAVRDQVLVLHSYHKAEWTDALNLGIFGVIGERPATDIHIEYMDTKKDKSPEYFALLDKVYARKYRSMHLRAVIVSDDDAFHFALTRHTELFGGSPIIFCGVNDFKPEMLTGHPEVSGVVEAGEFRETLEVARKLRPEARRILVIADETGTAQTNLAALREVLRTDAPELHEELLKDMSTNELQNRLASANMPDTIGFFISFWKDNTGAPVTPQELEDIFRSSATPIFGRSEWMIGKGQTGGKCVSGFRQGETAALIAGRILNGEDASMIPVVTESPNVFMFDYALLKRHGLDPDLLPPDSIVINRPEPFYRIEKPLAIALAVCLALLGLLAAILAAYAVERQRAAKILHSSESKARAILNQSFQFMGLLTLDGILIEVNRSALDLAGVTESSVLNKPFQDGPWWSHSPELQDQLREAVRSAAAGKPVRYETTNRSADGSIRYIDFSIRPAIDEAGNVIFLIPEGHDITERKQAEERHTKLIEQLHQSQKMDAIGQLAGGIAHDFNNLLTGIMSSAELLQNTKNLSGKQKKYTSMILTAAERAGNLTKKLLTFSKSGNKSSTAIDCVKIINDTVEILQHTIDKKITISIQNRAEQTLIIGDDSLLLNALMNMGINASHVMPQGGILTFSLENINLDKNYCDASSFDIIPGNYLEIAIGDTGSGMTPDVVSRIFEPFFTTNEQGNGTGLGLAMVYGTVQEHRGAITVYSEAGTGTVFRIYLPLTTDSIQHEINSEILPEDTGTILLIDDEELIRITAKGLLESLGYKVITAINGKDGVEAYIERKDEVDLVIIDMIMPVMGGREAFDNLRKINPEIPILISSGFAKEENMVPLKEQGVSGFLQKPFRLSDLAMKVRKALE